MKEVYFEIDEKLGPVESFLWKHKRNDDINMMERDGLNPDSMILLFWLGMLVLMGISKIF